MSQDGGDNDDDMLDLRIRAMSEPFMLPSSENPSPIQSRVSSPVSLVSQTSSATSRSSSWIVILDRLRVVLMNRQWKRKEGVRGVQDHEETSSSRQELNEHGRVSFIFA